MHFEFETFICVRFNMRSQSHPGVPVGFETVNRVPYNMRPTFKCDVLLQYTITMRMAAARLRWFNAPRVVLPSGWTECTFVLVCV